MPPAARCLKQARELKMTAVFSFGDGACTDKMAELAGAAAEGLVCSQAGIPVQASGKKFLDAYKAKFKADPILYSPFTYDAANMIIAAMKKADSPDPAKYLPALAASDHNGASGNIKFDEKGDRKDAEMTIFTLKDGKITPLAIIKGGKSLTLDEYAAAVRAAAAPAQAAMLHARHVRHGRACSGPAGGDERHAGHVGNGLRLPPPLHLPLRRRSKHPLKRTGKSPDRRLPRFFGYPRAMDILLQQIINGLTTGSVYAVVALGYTMVYGVIQLINFAHGEVVMIGAMVAFSIITSLAGSGMPPLAIVLAGVMAAIPACMAIGYLLERAAYRPLRHAPRLAPLITAIGMSIILQHAALLIWGRNPLAFPQIIENPSFSIGSAAISAVQITIILLSLLMMAGLSWFVYRTRFGIAIRATAENVHVASLMGINANRVIAATFVIGAGLGAVAGVMYGSYYGIAHYTMGFTLGLKAFSAAVLGGIGNIAGAMLGGLLLGLVEALGTGYIGDFSDLCRWPGASEGMGWMGERCADGAHFVVFGSNYQDVFAFLMLILVLVFRPSGLLGERVSERA
jgi:branched-chain amino acid transport system permease protein